jgi:hypothetical protein
MKERLQAAWLKVKSVLWMIGQKLKAGWGWFRQRGLVQKIEAMEYDPPALKLTTWIKLAATVLIILVVSLWVCLWVARMQESFRVSAMYIGDLYAKDTEIINLKIKLATAKSRIATLEKLADEARK